MDEVSAFERESTIVRSGRLRQSICGGDCANWTHLRAGRFGGVAGGLVVRERVSAGGYFFRDAALAVPKVGVGSSERTSVIASSRASDTAGMPRRRAA